MSIQKKVLLNTGSQIYMALLAVVTLPFYIEILGKPAYGLIAFFLQLQTLISLLDIGISATVSRNTTLFKIDKLSRKAFFTSVNSIEFIFYFIGLLLLAGGWWFAAAIVGSWLNLDGFDVATAVTAVQLTAVVIVIRWLQTFYRAVIFGAERIEWLSWFNIFFASWRVLFVIPVLLWIDGDIVSFFQYQLLLNVLELVCLILMSSRLLGYQTAERFGLVKVESIWIAVKSSAVIGVTSVVWALMTQADKMLASGVVTLTGYAAYSTVITVASVMVLLSAPLIYAIGPAMSRMIAEQKLTDAIQLFRNASLFIALILMATYTIALSFGEPLLLAWTDDRELVDIAHPMLPGYLTGTLFFALNYLSYSICYALGDFNVRLKLSLIALFCYGPVLAISIFLAAETGLIVSWLALNVVFFLAAQPLLYDKLQTGLYAKSVINDLLIPAIGCGSAALLAYFVDLSDVARWQVFFWCGVIFLISISIGVMGSRARSFVIPILYRVLGRKLGSR